MAEIYGGVDTGSARSGKEIRNERKWIAILFGDLIQTSEIYAETETAVFLLYE